jgi:uncharacterized protein
LPHHESEYGNYSGASEMPKSPAGAMELHPMGEASPVKSALSGISQAPRLVARGLIAAYRYTFAGLVGFHCRHLPTCSSYADEAIGRFGLWAGGWMTLARLCRCHPWGTSGLDVVPMAATPGQRWYLPWRYGRWRGVNAGSVPDPAGGDAPGA